MTKKFLHKLCKARHLSLFHSFSFWFHESNSDDFNRTREMCPKLHLLKLINFKSSQIIKVLAEICLQRGDL